jgi:hypothetical protein
MVTLEDLSTTGQKVAYLINQVPASKSNYKLLLLLYWQIFDGVEIPSEVVNSILENATEPETVARSKRRILSVDIDIEAITNNLKAFLEGEEVNEKSESKDK